MEKDEEKFSEILEEDLDADYVPTNSEVLDYARWIGIDPEEDEEYMWIAQEGLRAPLPKNWKPCKTKYTKEVYYFNFETGESTWDHPCDEFYKDLFKKTKTKNLAGQDFNKPSVKLSEDLYLSPPKSSKEPRHYTAKLDPVIEQIDSNDMYSSSFLKHKGRKLCLQPLAEQQQKIPLKRAQSLIFSAKAKNLSPLQLRRKTLPDNSLWGHEIKQLEDAEQNKNTLFSNNDEGRMETDTKEIENKKRAFDKGVGPSEEMMKDQEYLMKPMAWKERYLMIVEDQRNMFLPGMLSNNVLNKITGTNTEGNLLCISEIRVP
eukprot:snap_masked-scaffold_15-processed-gene-8.43-mRNA-1 protein AED:0.34 eAED:0.34 QI:0/-1/0/1/-1/1/1/0/316